MKKTRLYSKKFAFILMTTIIGMLIFNKAFFMHSHTLPDGKVVTHAHPFHKADKDIPEESHSHSSLYEFEFISSLDIPFLGEECIHLVKLQRGCQSIIPPPNPVSISASRFPDSGRSPPGKTCE